MAEWEAGYVQDPSTSADSECYRLNFSLLTAGCGTKRSSHYNLLARDNGCQQSVCNRDSSIAIWQHSP